jgi:phosphoglycolate phosphatase-like HAD superfamily hydrolase
MMDVISKPEVSNIKCVILDYDGTLTTFRKGWEFILYPYAKNCINPFHTAESNTDLEADLQHFVIHAGGTSPKQLMERLQELVQKHTGISREVDDYISEYGAIFNGEINRRLESFDNNPEEYVISGSREMLNFLNQQGIIMYIVTGSCPEAVSKELEKLGLLQLFLKVYGANRHTEGNHKEVAIAEIIQTQGLKKCEILIVGDGSTEIRAAAQLGLPALGIASDEHTGGLCPKKKENLTRLGAHIIIPDYRKFTDVWSWLHN